ncbi:hypothetical protein PInf_002655 [Phytophthora infestans]|nr:hypothetical protein PInf_002655 [Phytophthora infestans]
MCPRELPEEGTLVEMRAARKRAIREVKAFERARRRERLQNRRHQRRNDGVTRRAKLLEKKQKPAKSYVYQKKGNYGDVELVAGADGRGLYGKCITRDAPVDAVEGFEADEHECWECGDLSDWMVEKQVKMNFATRELKYRDEGSFFHQLIDAGCAHRLS